MIERLKRWDIAQGRFVERSRDEWAVWLQDYAAMLWGCSGRREDAPFVRARDHAAQVYAQARQLMEAA